MQDANDPYDFEVWTSLDFVGFPKHEISSWGNVRYTSTNRPIKTHVNPNNTLYVTLSFEGHRQNFHVGELVLLAFEGPHPNIRYNSVIFKDCRRDNAFIGNLMWALKSEMLRYNRSCQVALVNGYYKTEHIVNITTGRSYSGALEAAAYEGIPPTEIYRLAHGLSVDGAPTRNVKFDFEL